MMAQGGTLDRIMGAMFLNVDTYEEVEHDSSLTGEAAVIVFLHSIAAALGSAGIFGGLMGGVRAGIAALVGWLLWAGVTYLIGDKLLGGTATWGELLRTLGYAHSPGLLLVLGIIPFLGWLVFPIVGIWMLIAGLIAIRQALDFSTGKALLTALLGLIAVAALRALVG